MTISTNFHKFIGVVLVALLGLLAGAYAGRDVQPRSFLAVDRCEQCLEQNDFLGLVAAVGIKLTPGLLPSIVLETDKSIAFRHPFPDAKTHIVVVPKRDIKNAADLTEEDGEYVVDAYGVMGQIVREQSMEQYRIVTNGPGYQHVTYLHFHLLSKD